MAGIEPEWVQNPVEVTKNMSSPLLSMSAPHRPLCELLGCTHPIVLAGMGGVARAELVAAVTLAGGFGFLGMVREPVALIRREVQRVRAQTGSKFGVNLIPAATEAALLEAQVDACIELEVPVVCLFWDIDPALVRRLRAAGILVVYQVGSVNEARLAEQAGANILIAQGCEAGGHVRGDTPLATLLPAVLAATTLPVLAAGGIADGADVARVLQQGAQGAVIGTAFIPTHESFAHAYHMQRIVEAPADSTILTTAFHINWPKDAKVRVLHNSVTRGAHGDPFQAHSKVIGDEEGRPIHLFSTDSPLRSMTGDFEAMALYAGAGVGRVASFIGAGERLRQIVSEAAILLSPGNDEAFGEGDARLHSPVCFADQADDAYMGFVPREELLAALAGLLRSQRHAANLALAAAAPGACNDARRNCAALSRAILSLQGTLPADAEPGASAEAVVPQQDDIMGQAQTQFLQELRILLPRIRDADMQAQLAALLPPPQNES